MFAHKCNCLQRPEEGPGSPRAGIFTSLILGSELCKNQYILIRAISPVLTGESLKLNRWVDSIHYKTGIHLQWI